MNAVETMGMISTGALVMLGAMYLFGPLGQPAPGPASVLAAAPLPVAAPLVAAPPVVPATVAPAPVAPATVAPAPLAPQPVLASQAAVVVPETPATPATSAAAEPQVTRLQSDMTGSPAIGQLESFVALAMRPVSVDVVLTPAQEEIIAYFRRTARDLNTASGSLAGDYVAFNDMAIDGLQIRHFYTVRQELADLNVAELIAAQTELVQGNLCNEPMMQTLIQEHGFSFVYSYVSSDNRFLGNVSGDLSACI